MNRDKIYKDNQRGYQQQIVMRDYPDCSKVYLVPLSDFHIGNPYVDLRKICGYLDWLKAHDNAFAILNGDMMECATKDRVPDLWEVLRTPDDCYKEVRELLMPVKDKIVMITRGNHEEMIWNKAGTDFTARLADDLGVDYKPNGGMVGIGLHKNGHTGIVWIYATHGWGGARTRGAKVKKPEDLSRAVQGVHCLVVSHDHTQNIGRLNPLVPPKSRISFKRPVYWRRQRIMLVNSGGFIDYGGYVQRKGYEPQDLGTPRILFELRNTTKGLEGYHIDIHASI